MFPTRLLFFSTQWIQFQGGLIIDDSTVLRDEGMNPLLCFASSYSALSTQRVRSRHAFRGVAYRF